MRKVRTGCSELNSEKHLLAQDSLVHQLANPERQVSPGYLQFLQKLEREKRWLCTSECFFSEDWRLYKLVEI